MSVRVVARVRPLLKQELERDVIVQAAAEGSSENHTVIRLPNPKNEAELFGYHFNGVYDQSATQKQVFDKEVAPTVKHLFNGFDVTIFAYGVTGTGKTHTMRGGKSLADRGVIPRLLSGIYRKSKKLETDSAGASQVDVAMSYYEIYNDRVHDLFQSPEKRTATGLPIRENNGKTVVCGLTERPCTTLKEFEKLYDEANVNRSTSATKLNAHSSRSHAILCVKLTQRSESQTTISTASAIDLAGSEDNRRTENNKDRMVESASINKSLFVLAQCVEAIGKKQSRIPYRESKMTRILSLGQNNGFTVMILNLAPIRSYHLDTISSLNLASRTKKIEVNEVENEPIFRTGPAVSKITASIQGANINRQPLRPLTSVHTNNGPPSVAKATGKPMKSFAVYSDKSGTVRGSSLSDHVRKPDSRKRPLDATQTLPSRISKVIRTGAAQAFAGSRAGVDLSLSKATIEEMIEKRVEAKLAERAQSDQNTSITLPSLPLELQTRLDRLEQRISEKDDDERAEGLHYLLMAKQHQIRSEDSSALKMYQLAAPYFPNNERLPRKVAKLQEKLRAKREAETEKSLETDGQFANVVKVHNIDPEGSASTQLKPKRKPRRVHGNDSDYEEQTQPNADDDYVDDTNDSDDSIKFKPKSKPRKITQNNTKRPLPTIHNVTIIESGPVPDEIADEGEQTPRTAQLLRIINSRDVSQIRLLKGVGLKKAEAIVGCLGEEQMLMGLDQLGELKGVGAKGVVNMREGLVPAPVASL